MSNIGTLASFRKNAFPLLLYSSLVIGTPACLPMCAPALEPLVPGRPALVGLKAAVETVDEITVNAKLPSTPAWHVQLRREVVEGKTRWVFAERSDRPEFRDLADDSFVDHFLETLSTFETEAEAPQGNDSIFGFTPHRIEVRLRRKNAEGKSVEDTLLLGDTTGLSNAYFRRRANEKQTWIGRGAFVSFLLNLREPDSFAWKYPYFASHEQFLGLELEKTLAPNAGKWNFTRRFERDEKTWIAGNRPVDRETTILLERLVRQRVLAWPEETGGKLPSDFPTVADWRIQAVLSESESETLEIFFALDRVYGRNPKRSSRVFELYPEFAGTLRALTQLRSTQARSGTK
jgi:hypothetical protein